MIRFAIIGHAPNFEFLDRYFEEARPGFRRRRKALMKKVLEWMPPHEVGDPVVMPSNAGRAAEAIFIHCPLLPEQFVTLDRTAVVAKVVAAAKLAADRGAQLVGLNGFTSIATDGGRAVAPHVPVPVTTGNTLTAAMVIDGVRAAARRLGRELGSATMLIVGASGDIGSACARVFAHEVRTLILCARDRAQLDAQAAGLRGARAHVHVVGPGRDDVGADVVVCATSAVTAIVEPSALKSGSIVCDVGIPRNVSLVTRRERPDVFVFDGGLLRLPAPVTYGFAIPQPTPQSSLACTAEAAVLALEGHLESYSLGSGEIRVDRMQAVRAMAARHGWTLDRFRSGPLEYGPRDFERFRDRQGAPCSVGEREPA